MVDENELSGVGDGRQPWHELRVIDSRAAVESDHDGFVDQLVAFWSQSGAVHVKEQLHSVDSDTHDLLPGLDALARLAASEHGVLEASPDLIVRRMHRTMMVPDFPDRIASAIVAQQYFGLAHSERRGRQDTRRQFPARLYDATNESLVGNPRHVATHLDPHVDDFQFRDAVVLAN